MKTTIPKIHPGLVIVLGSVWGFSEAALGMGLKSCAAFISGSIMTGVALFFLAMVWICSRRITTLIMVVLIVSLFKIFDALILSLPILHGAISNPIFAFFTETVAFVILILIMAEKVVQRPIGQALLGGLAALVSVNLFPLVKYVTGIPACTIAGTGYPLSLYYIYVAVSVSFITVPLGFWVGNKLQILNLDRTGIDKKFSYIFSPATVVLCLTIITILRLI